jgi:hypothetical protein
MTYDEIAVLAYCTLADHFETVDSGFWAESTRWRQLAEQFGMTERSVQAVASEVCGSHGELHPEEFYEKFKAASVAYFRTGKRRAGPTAHRCGFCRDLGFAEIYSRRDPSVTEAVGCFCGSGAKVLQDELQAVQKLASSDYHPSPRFASAITDTSLIDPIRLFFRHGKERADAWAEKNGLSGKPEAEYLARYRQVVDAVRSGMFEKPEERPRTRNPKSRDEAREALAAHRSTVRPPEVLNPESLALAAWANGDERNEWE